MFTDRAVCSRIVFCAEDLRRMALGALFCAAVFCARTSVWAGHTTTGQATNSAQSNQRGGGEACAGEEGRSGQGGREVELPEGNCPSRIDKQHVAEKKGDYARKHVPFLSFREVQEKWCDRVVRVDSVKGNSLLGQGNFFVKDAKAGLVAYSFYSPNMNNDGHNTNVQVAAAWVRRFLDQTLTENLRKGTLVVVTFDESDHNADNRIFTLLLGDMVKEANQQDPRVLDRHYTHYSVLRTIEDNFGLEPLADGDRDASPITDIWK